MVDPEGFHLEAVTNLRRLREQDRHARITTGIDATADRLAGAARLQERQPGSGSWRLDREL
jgi:hypothetical protein